MTPAALPDDPGAELRDLAAARAAAAARTDEALDAGGPALTVVEEIRHGLLAASVRTVINAVSPRLAERLVDAGLWPIEGAVAHAALYPGVYARVDLLTRLLPRLPEDCRPALAAEVLDAARGLDGHTAAGLYAALGDHLAPGDRAVVVAAARALPDDGHRCLALTGLAAHLSGAARAEALRLAETRAAALARLAPHLTPAELAAARRAAEALPEPAGRAEALAGLAPYVPAPDRAGVVRAAFAAAAQMPDDVRGTGRLVALAPLLPDDLVEAALAAVLDLWLPHLLTALRRLAPRLSPAQLERAADELDRFVVDEFRGRGYVVLAPYLPPERVRRMVSAAAGFPGRPERMATTIGLAPYLPPDDRQAALTRALADAPGIDDHDERAAVVAALMPHLTGEARRRGRAASAALVPSVGSYALPLVAPHLDPSARDVVVASALARATAYPARTDLVARLAPLLSGEQLVAALAHAEGVGFLPDRVAGVIALLPHLPAGTRDAALGRLMAAVDAETNPISRARLLGDLAPHLSPTGRAAALATAVELIATIGRPYSRAYALAAVRPHLPAAEGAGIAAGTLADAARIGAEEVALARQFIDPPAGDARPPVARIRAALDAGGRGEVLAALAPLVPAVVEVGGPGAAGRLLDVVGEVTERWP
ncbi:hypothetical protein [Dactylosporangium sp. CA-233914]|uniref:hypothetical protein n=1 Tax=Dactylosporangium sp. CA-233914 TaxID=3239934 RepID=UPI003D93D3DE